MTAADRVGELLEGVKSPVRKITSPEGVELNIRIAGRGERMTAFLLDMMFLTGAIMLVYIIGELMFISRFDFSLAITLISFAAFVMRNMYFLHFELAWQGRTPGKKICGIRVVSADGGELTPRALIARNIMREAEFFLPMALFFRLGDESGWSGLAAFGWAVILTGLPLFNRDRLRAGDMIAGTIVIKMPKRALLPDLVSESGEREDAGYSFRPEQLSVYGAFELQVLEELLRKKPTPEVNRVLSDVCAKICRNIGVEENIPPQNVRAFLSDFYRAERAMLEHGQLFGYYKEDKNTPGAKI
jgi:uncharacterized RDD family membrane protein YckC